MTATIGTKLFTFFKGKYVGRDEFGNMYYQERRPGRESKPKRWVIYNGMPEPSKVPPYWHGWLHYADDHVPIEGEQVKRYDWQKDHIPNATGTALRYVPQGHISKGGKRAASTADFIAWKPE